MVWLNVCDVVNGKLLSNYCWCDVLKFFSWDSLGRLLQKLLLIVFMLQIDLFQVQRTSLLLMRGLLKTTGLGEGHQPHGKASISTLDVNKDGYKITGRPLRGHWNHYFTHPSGVLKNAIASYWYHRARQCYTFHIHPSTHPPIRGIKISVKHQNAWVVSYSHLLCLSKWESFKRCKHANKL